MNPKIVEVKVMEDTTGKFRVFANGICVGLFFKEHNAEDYVEDIKELNQDKVITRID